MTTWGEMWDQVEDYDGEPGLPDRLLDHIAIWAADRAALAEVRMAIAALQALGPGSMVAGRLPPEWEWWFLVALDDLYHAASETE